VFLKIKIGIYLFFNSENFD